jgi:hypothetical protein
VPPGYPVRAGPAVPASRSTIGSARGRSDRGTPGPRVPAVPRAITSASSVGCSMGRSTGWPTPQGPVHVAARPPERVVHVGPTGHEAAGASDVRALMVHRRQPVPSRQLDDPGTMREEAGRHEEAEGGDDEPDSPEPDGATRHVPMVPSAVPRCQGPRRAAWTTAEAAALPGDGGGQPVATVRVEGTRARRSTRPPDPAGPAWRALPIQPRGVVDHAETMGYSFHTSLGRTWQCPGVPEPR